MRLKRIAILALALPVIAGGAQAAAPLKVCAGENDLPYSDKNKAGFENKLAELIGQDLGRTVEYVWWSDPRLFIRDQLDRGLCDVVIGVDAGDPRLLTTSPYYRSGYVFVVRKDKGLKLADWDDAYLKKANRIAFVPDTPAEAMIRKIGRYNDLFNYQQSLVGFKSKRNQYIRFDPEKLVQEVAGGNADLAVIWGPQAGRYVKQADKTLELRVIPDHQVRADGQKVPHHYSSAIGVRKGEKALAADIDRVLKKRNEEIQTLLKEEGIPLLPLDEPGARAEGSGVDKQKAG
ncbi:methanol oxidation system protein MoxJ [Methylococcus sp. EFPC2]|uniref:methanol oxidation system protein MoxJ n=1 Tax=Methylococcus sp. EFPC2 TaxID=2812648 RepID=UPI0019686100|nr:methanol oxidation system protein MoxJ [Methylococcus sp. EFPC2]QSA97371.1 methanol oxidation system protein MoxJ [Methylococcus sp. EFPC2]